MKKCLLQRRLYLKRIADNRFKRKFRNKVPIFGFNSSTTRTFLQINAPDVFDISDIDTRFCFLKFLARLRQKVLVEKKNVKINFSPTKRIISGAGLLFTSELCRMDALKAGYVKIRCLPPRIPKIYQVFEQIGVFRLLEFNNKIKPHDHDVVHWRVAKGSGADGEKYDAILGYYDGKIPEILSTGFYLGLTEAMTNAQHHAYTEPRDDEIKIKPESKDWWMFSQEKDGRLNVVFCDLGIGISRSLPIKKPKLWKKLIEKYSAGIHDGDIIAEAVEESSTRTGEKHRGKGLQQMASVINEIQDAELRIYSNKGCYTKINHKVKVWHYKTSILGTLIMWSVPIDG